MPDHRKATNQNPVSLDSIRPPLFSEERYSSRTSEINFANDIERPLGQRKISVESMQSEGFSLLDIEDEHLGKRLGRPEPSRGQAQAQKHLFIASENCGRIFCNEIAGPNGSEAKETKPEMQVTAGQNQAEKTANVHDESAATSVSEGRGQNQLHEVYQGPTRRPIELEERFQDQDISSSHRSMDQEQPLPSFKRQISSNSDSTVLLGDLNETEKIGGSNSSHETIEKMAAEVSQALGDYGRSEEIYPSSAGRQKTSRSEDHSCNSVHDEAMDEEERHLDALLSSLNKSEDESEDEGRPQLDLSLFKTANNGNASHQHLLEQLAMQFAQSFGGSYVPVKVRFMLYFTFKCSLGHKFELSSDQILEKQWCQKCGDLWCNLLKVAKKKDSMVIDKFISPQVNIRCMRNHLFRLKPTEYASLMREKIE